MTYVGDERRQIYPLILGLEARSTQENFRKTVSIIKPARETDREVRFG